MRISLFTPTHDPKYLAETFRSLELQTYEDWEWVISPNCQIGSEMPVIPAAIRDHPKVRVVPHRYADKPRIGDLKRFCCDHASGDVFFELDHDDLVVPNSLEKVAFEATQGAGFIYSDTALFNDDKHQTVHCYSGDWGFESYEAHIFGKPFLATRNFPLTARSLCEIFGAPDHLRAWSRKTYYEAGGHDPAMEVADDHDLMCRSYLTGSPFVHIGGVGYLYRTHAQNTVKTHNAQIQQGQAAVRDKYIYKLIDEWTRREGFAYVDFQKYLKQWLTEGKLKIGTSKVGCIRAYDCLQLVPQDQVVSLMNELYRVLVPGGWLCVRMPAANGAGAYAPHFRSHWSKHTFDYFCDKKWGRQVPDRKARFQCVRTDTYYPTKDDKQNDRLFVFADLCALKGQRQPGQVKI